MSPPPVRVETKASASPDGENRGRDSVAGCDTSRRASPPPAGTLQRSPPDANAISRPSGEMPGSAKTGPPAGDWVEELAAKAATSRTVARARRRVCPMPRSLPHDSIGRNQLALSDVGRTADGVEGACARLPLSLFLCWEE